MEKKYHFFLLSETGTPTKQIAVSRFYFRCACLLLTVCIMLAGYGLYDYLKIKKSIIYNKELSLNISNQSEEIAHQRSQIQLFAKEITELKLKLVNLNDFERKIRVIANIERKPEQGSLFGVGGPIPEDLNTKIPISEKHNSLIREMHEQTEQINLAVSKQEEGFESLLKYLEGKINLLASTPAIRPTDGWITSRFCRRKSPFTGLMEFHKGIDIAARKGTKVIATADGIVSFAGNKGFLGKLIIIDHGHGIVTKYGHNYKLLKKRGETVKRGEIIALIGSSGRTTGPHVHYEVYLNGIPVNPMKYILN